MEQQTGTKKVNKTSEGSWKDTKLALAFGIMWGVGLWGGWYLTVSGVL